MTLICYANDSSSTSRVQHTFAIAVANASDNPIIVFDVRKTFVLNCSIANNTNKLKVKWFNNEQEITDSDAVYYHFGEAQLHILNATDLNEGVYKCVVEIKGASASKIKLYQTFKTAFKPYWSKWSPWSRCQPKCGKNSTKRRVRVCHRSKLLQPYAKWHCPGENMQRKRCTAVMAFGPNGRIGQVVVEHVGMGKCLDIVNAPPMLISCIHVTVQMLK